MRMTFALLDVCGNADSVRRHEFLFVGALIVHKFLFVGTLIVRSAGTCTFSFDDARMFDET
jgi:hypothetical protein